MGLHWRLSRRELLKSSLAVSSLVAVRRALSAETFPAPKWVALPEPVAQGFHVGDPSPLGYVAEEYLVSGVGPTYKPVSNLDNVAGGMVSFSPPSSRVPLSPGPALSTAPYTTRFIIYRPNDMKRFSGNVMFEADGIHWAASNLFFAKRGDVVVIVQQPFSFTAVRKAAPGRYDQFNMPDWTVIWSAVAQVGTQIKTAGAGSPLSVRARRMYFMGHSITSAFAGTFAKFHHEGTRISPGVPIFDGYFPTGGASTWPVFPDAAIIQMATQSDFYGFTDNTPLDPDARFGGDHDKPVGRSRYYEIAGAIHSSVGLYEAGGWLPAGRTADEPVTPTTSIKSACESQFPAGSVRNDMPWRAIVEGSLRNLSDWVDHDVAPPHAPLFELSDTAVKGNGAKHDADGNQVGGLRLPDLSVPVATYGVGVGSSCQLDGYRMSFTPEHCKALYGDKATYLARYDAATDKMVSERWILPDRAEKMKLHARATAPDF